MKLNKVETRLVVELIATDWAKHAVRCMGFNAKIQSPYSVYLWGTPAKARHRFKADNRRRAALAAILRKQIGDLPDIDTDAFIQPFKAYGGKGDGEPQYDADKAKAERQRLVKLIVAKLD